MKSSRKTTPIAVVLAFCLALPFPIFVSASEADSSIAACLIAWGDQPFGKTPQFKTLGTSVRVFGLGAETADTEPTSSPSLTLINPSFNLMGGSTIELLNPNGWYCLRTTVTIMGGVSIRANCKARLAETSDGNAMLANSTDNRGIKDLNVTVMGSVSIERPCS